SRKNDTAVAAFRCVSVRAVRCGRRCPRTPPRPRKVGSEVAVVNIHQHYVLGIVADDRLRITPTVAIDASDLTYRVSRSGGPGGQHAHTKHSPDEATLEL